MDYFTLYSVSRGIVKVQDLAHVSKPRKRSTFNRTKCSSLHSPSSKAIATLTKFKCDAHWHKGRNTHFLQNTTSEKEDTHMETLVNTLNALLIIGFISMVANIVIIAKTN